MQKATYIVITTMLLLIVMAQLAGCGGNAQKARQWFEQGRKDFNNDSIFGALVNLQRAMDEAERAGDDETHFEAAVHLAMIYDQAGQRDRSYELLNGLKYVEATTDPYSFSSQYYYRVLAAYHGSITHNYDSAIYYSQQAIALDRRLYPNDTAFVLTDMANLAESYMHKGDTAKAWHLVRQIETAPRPAYQIYLCQTYYLHSLLAQQVDTAYHYAQLGYRYSLRLKSPTTEIDCLEQMYHLDSTRTGTAPSCLKIRLLADSCNEKLRGGEVAYRIATLREQGKIERLREESKNNRIIGGMVIAMLALTVMGLLMMMRMAKRNAQAKQRLAEATIQREMLEKELLQLRIKKNEEKLEAANKKNLNMTELITEMKNTITDNDDHESLLALETTLKTEYGDFLDRVSKLYPSLTGNDIRLMGFIKMGVKPKVMAMALNISTNSLNSARYRLRKRLNISNDVNLNEFIQNI